MTTDKTALILISELKDISENALIEMVATMDQVDGIERFQALRVSAIVMLSTAVSAFCDLYHAQMSLLVTPDAEHCVTRRCLHERVDAIWNTAMGNAKEHFDS